MKYEISGLIAKIGWNKRFFAGHMGITEKTAYNWCSNGAPKHVHMYLEQIAKVMNV